MTYWYRVIHAEQNIHVTYWHRVMHAEQDIQVTYWYRVIHAVQDIHVDVGKLGCRNAQIPLYMYNEALCHLLPLALMNNQQFRGSVTYPEIEGTFLINIHHI